MAKRVTNGDFIDRIYNLVGNEYTFLEEYKGRHSKILCRHEECGYVWEVEAGAFLGNKNKRGSRCPSCYGNIKKTTKEFYEEVDRLSEGEIELISDYRSAREDATFKHIECGKEFKMFPNTFLSGSRCPYCRKNRPYNQTRAEERIKEFGNGEYTLVSGYNGCFNHMEIRHDPCGSNVYKTMQGLARNGISCYACFGRSEGERMVAKYLKENDITFREQYRFNELRRNPFDFYLPNRGTIIEYHGKQHYQPIDFFGGEEHYQTQKKRDKMKEDFARKQRYNVVILDYRLDTQEDINKFLESKLK